MGGESHFSQPTFGLACWSPLRVHSSNFVPQKLNLCSLVSKKPKYTNVKSLSPWMFCGSEKVPGVSLETFGNPENTETQKNVGSGD